MKVTPKSEDEIARDGLLSDGTYDFETIEAVDTTSRAGNDMIRLKLKVFDNNGGFRIVDDYLLDAMAYKVRHAAESFGLLEAYENGELSADDMIGKAGQVKIGTQQDKEKQYPPRNVVKDYVVVAGAPASPKKQPAMAGSGGRLLDDDIPFAPEFR